ncbi:MAG: hypothetical protein QM731_06030 [Chitinophagaceae bacterium]
MNMNVNDCIAFLEQSNDPVTAYFSYDVDEMGERGIIRANKEGLRLYAMELLKMSVGMEAASLSQPICFDHFPWLISDAGYDLIAAVQPEYSCRAEIVQRDIID